MPQYSLASSIQTSGMAYDCLPLPERSEPVQGTPQQCRTWDKKIQRRKLITNLFEDTCIICSAYCTYLISTYLHIASTSACADEWGAGRVASHSFLSYLQKWEIIETTCKSRKLFLLADSHLALMKRSFSSLGVSGPGFLSPGCNLQ